jgi:hypothetical protein
VTLTINDRSMTSDQSAHTARRSPGRNGWEVSWLPGQTLDRNSAITAMTLADTTAEPGLAEGHPLWPHVQSWAGELGLTPPDAIARISQPPSDPNRQQEQTSRQPDREAADLHDQHHTAPRPAQLAAAKAAACPLPEKHRVTDV